MSSCSFETALVKTFFDMTTHLKIFHWQTSSYAKHKASDMLYDKLSEFIDAIVEYDQGVNEKFTINDKTFVLQNMDEEDAVFLLQQMSLFLDLLVTKDKGIRAKRDDLIGHIHQALYLFKLT